MSNDINNAAICDILSLLGILTATIGSLWSLHIEKRLVASRDILFDEIEQGIFSNIPSDDKISLMHRYAQAAMNGTARINLRLLAQAINSLAKGEKLAKPVYANKFNRYAQSLETLSEEEIKILAKLYHMREEQKEYVDKNKVPIPGMQGSYSERFETNLEYSDIENKEKTMASLCALLRTGLIYQTGIGALRTIQYELSPFFDEIIQLVDFEDALKKETQE